MGEGPCVEPPIAAFVRIVNVRDSVTMRRALRIGLFIGTFIGMSACAALPDDGSRGGYGGVEVGRTR